ncbi:MAG: homoserine O-succinyltransferase [Elusimicrobiota bacterium]|jgi:homoserine O-succinyltransferase|nr:homoserine O-succinyltransferase [Elusimicrobiota bacterium]
MIEVCILNLMPAKEAAERQLSGLLGAGARITWLTTASYTSKNTPREYIKAKYVTFDKIKNRSFDIFIITGAPVELMAFKEVAYWRELTQILDYTRANSKFNVFICWAAQAALHYFYGVDKYALEGKYAGIFKQKIENKASVFCRGIEDGFNLPHSRHTSVKRSDLQKIAGITIEAACGPEVSIAYDGNLSALYITGHPEYDAGAIHLEYLRDAAAGLNPALPVNYYPQDNARLPPADTWRKAAEQLYKNIINHVKDLKEKYNENI